MAIISRKIDEFAVIEIEESWGTGGAYILIRDPDDCVSASVSLTGKELKALHKEIKTILGKDGK